MASIEKQWHKVTTPSGFVKIYLPDLYDGIGAKVGITKITEEGGGDLNPMSMSDGLKNGILVRLRLTVKDTTTNKSKSARILCAAGNVRNAIADLPALTYRAQNIRSAGVPRRRRLG